MPTLHNTTKRLLILVLPGGETLKIPAGGSLSVSAEVLDALKAKKSTACFFKAGMIQTAPEPAPEKAPEQIPEPPEPVPEPEPEPVKPARVKK